MTSIKSQMTPVIGPIIFHGAPAAFDFVLYDHLRTYIENPAARQKHISFINAFKALGKLSAIRKKCIDKQKTHFLALSFFLILLPS